MTHDRHDQVTIRRDLQRWRDLLKTDVDQDGRRVLRELIDGAEKRLHEIEGHATADTTEQHRLQEPRKGSAKHQHRDEDVIHLGKRR
jgi:hypothetical protein